MKRVAIYARYSSDNQREASIDDQVRICRERAEKEGWTIMNVHTDYAISGASMERAGIKELKQDIKAGRIDIVLTESLSRISRDQEDIAGFFKRTRFARVKIVTLGEGEIGPLHIGLKGTMNAIYLEDMADTVWRGQEGRVMSGFMGGGNCYGYDVMKRLDARGEVIRGERSINRDEAEIVRRIFREYADGHDTKLIAIRLNADGVPGPSGRGWGPSTIYGNWQRGAGILNNELYIGQIVWNKVSYPKDPDTGRHVTRNNPESEWVRKEVPELRIVEQELWDRVKARQKRVRTQSKKKYWEHRLPRHLLSYRLKCGVCGGGMSKISTHNYGCSTARNKGDALCKNHQTIRQDRLEKTVLEVLQKNLMDPKLVAVFCKEYTAHINRLRMEHNVSLNRYKAEIDKLKRRQKRIVQAVMDGFATDDLKRESNAIVEREIELQGLIAGQQEAPVLLHPSMAQRYRTEVSNLIDALDDTKHRQEAIRLIQGLIEKVVVCPDPNSKEMTIDLYGDLAGILNMSMKKDKALGQEFDLKQIRLVVGLDSVPTVPQSLGTGRKAYATALSRSTRQQQEKLVGPAGLEPATRPL